MRVYVQEQRPRTVMVAETAATADLIAATLAAHGIEASTTASYVGAYPSVDWVQGYRVGVPADQIDQARDVLDVLSGRSDVASVDESDLEGGASDP